MPAGPRSRAGAEQGFARIERRIHVVTLAAHATVLGVLLAALGLA